MKGLQMSKSNRGRPKGAHNKIANEAKRAILMAFDMLGGVQRLVEWVQEDKANEFAFYAKIYPMLLPRPAVEAPPQPEQAAPVKGAFTWRTPDWARKVEKEQFRRGMAQVGGTRASSDERGGGGGRPPPHDEDGEED